MLRKDAWAASSSPTATNQIASSLFLCISFGLAELGRQADGQAGKNAGHKDVRAERPLMKFLDAEASERRECIHPPRLNARLQRPTKSQECESETHPK